MHHVCWLRHDLRCADNTALLAASAQDDAAVTALYLITPTQWREHEVAAVRVDFELRQLAVLREDLAALGIPLVVLQAERYDDVPSLLREWCRTHAVDEMHANIQHEVNERARDAGVTVVLGAAGVRCHWHEDLCILPPGRVLTGEGRPYTVFSPFKRNWLQQLGSGSRPRGLPARRRRQAPVASEVPSALPDWTPHVDEPLRLHLWPAGEQAAHARLASFADADLGDYDRQRDRPAINGTSTLSPYLAAGILSARQCLAVALQRRAAGGRESGIDTWISELCWRDFYKHILVHFPHVCRGRAFRRETDAIAWRDDDALFEAWCEGRTGYPIVDAAMRQLRETGWMHNRLRMITAMFLSKDLFIDWRRGESHFMRHLIDGDFSANNGGWQWSASTGNDAAPYFRVFNPESQGRKFDPDGEFIRRFVPELAGLDAARIHAPHAKSVFPGYALPVVDHGAARLHAIASFKALGEAARDSA